MNFSGPTGISAGEMHAPQPDLPTTAPPLRPVPDPDARIIAAALRDPGRFSELFDRHWTELHAFCTSRMGAAGEDLAADTFRLAFDRRARYDQRYDDARPWLYGIATNLIRQHFRTAQRRGRAEERSAMFGRRVVADETIGGLERRLLGPELAAALAELSAIDRDALLLFAWAELDYAEIARALDVPIGTVRSRINRARRMLQARLPQRNHDV